MVTNRRNRFGGTLAALAGLAAASCGPQGPPGIIEETGSLAVCLPERDCVHTGMRHPDGTRGMYTNTGIPRAQIMDSIAQVVTALPGATVVTRNPDYMHAEVRDPGGAVSDLELMISFENELIVRAAARDRDATPGPNADRVAELRARLDSANVLR